MRLAAILLAMLAPTVAHAASPMQPGLWESTVSVSRNGRVPLVSVPGRIGCVWAGELR